MLHLLDTDTVIYILKRRPPHVANNVREFERIPGLRVENWTAA